VQLLWKNIWRLLKNLNIDLPYDSAISLLGDTLKGMRHRLLQRHLHSHVYCSAIHNCKVMQTAKMPHTVEWIKKMWYLHTMEYYSAMKKNEILSFARKWMELENIILSEVRQAQKTKNCMFSLI
jgi:hypothetical protein